MVLDKTLLLKGLAGVATVGGVGGGICVAYKTGAFKSREEIEKEEKAKEEKKKLVNDKLSKLGIEGCDLVDKDVTSPTTFSKDCVLDQDKFKKIKFSNKGDNDVNVAGWTNGNTVKLTISNKPGEDNGIKFLFEEVKDDLIISKSSTDQTDNFSIKKDKKTEFEEKSEKLSKIISDQATSEKLKNYNTKFQTLSLPQTCRFDDTEDEKKLECEIKGSELKNIKFSNKGDRDALTLNGLTDAGKIKLIIERAGSGASESLKYKFKNDSSSKIILTGTTGDQAKFSIKAGVETKFEEKNGKLSKIISSQETSQKLKTYNTKLGNLKLPDDCRFDITETDTSFECDVTTANITKIKFSNKETNDLTISEGSDFTGLKLNISGSGSNLKFNFKSGNKKIKLSNSSNKHVFIKQGEESGFEFKGEALHKVLSSNVSELAKKVDLVCEYGDSGDGGTCKKGDNKSYLNVSEKTNPSNYETIGIGGGGSSNYKNEDVKFNFQEDQAGYEKGVKFTFTGNEISNGSVKLEKNVSYEIKTIGDFDCFSKKDPQ